MADAIDDVEPPVGKELGDFFGPIRRRCSIFLADAETGELVDANEAAADLVGRSRDELIGMHQTDLHPPEKADEYRRDQCEIEQFRFDHFQLVGPDRDGSCCLGDNTSV